MSHSKRILEQVLRDLIEDAGEVDLVPKLARLWWTSTHELEEKCVLSINTKLGRHEFPFEEKFEISGRAMIRREVQDLGMCFESAKKSARRQ